MLAECFKGHGTYIYDPKTTFEKFDGNGSKLVDAIKQMGMRHAWVWLHDLVEPDPSPETFVIVKSLLDGGIHVAGWGWCHGSNPESEAKVACAMLQRYGLIHYVADIEEGRVKPYGTSHWTDAAIRTFFETFRQLAHPDAQVLVSSHGYISRHSPDLMQAADSHVDGFAPQIYWFNYPDTGMCAEWESSPNAPYVINNPASYGRLCIDVWHQYTQKPLLLTGQAYWGEHEDYTRAVAEQKVHDFLAEFSQWPRIVGLNWWHLGSKRLSDDQGVMSPEMMDAITAANVSQKAFGG